MIADAKQVAPGASPFFMYFCPGANHAPHHAPKEWADKYKGTFDMGYERSASRILERAEGDGHRARGRPSCRRSTRTPRRQSVDGKAVATRSDVVRPWDSLSTTRSSCSAGMAEVYAGFSSYTDHEIGRLIDYLEQTGQLDNTMIVVISDNGASGEGGPNGSVNENKFFNSVPDDIDENLPVPRRARLAGDLQPLPDRLGVGLQHPVQDVQAHTWDGGIGDPMIVHWPRRHQGQGRDPRPVHPRQRRRADHLRLPRASSRPRRSRATPSGRWRASSFKYSFDDADAPTPEGDPVLRRCSGTRAIWHDGWKAVTRASRRSPAGATSPRTGGSCTTPTRTAPSATTWRPSTRRSSRS